MGQREDLPRQNQSSFYASLCCIILWTCTNLLHDVGAFATAWPSALGYSGGSPASYLICVAQPAGFILACLYALASSRPAVKSRFLRFPQTAKGPLLLIGGLAGASLGFYGAIILHAFFAAALFNLIASFFCAALLLMLIERLAEENRSLFIGTICLAQAPYALARGILFTMDWQTSSLGMLTLAQLVLLLVTAWAWHRSKQASSPEEIEATEGSAEGKEPQTASGSSAVLIPRGLIVHVLGYGIGFGLLHMVLSVAFSYDAPYEPLALFVGVVFACTLTIFSFGKIPKVNEIWLQVRGVIFPSTIAALMLLELYFTVGTVPSAALPIPGILLKFAEVYYLLVFTMGCYFIIEESALPRLRVFAVGYVLLNTGALIGRVAGALVDGVITSNTTIDLQLLALFIFFAFSLGTFWIGDDDTLKKWWGLRIHLSPKKRFDKVLRDKCRELSKAHDLSQRESEILLMLAEGKRAAQIEQECYISIHTVRNHIHNIYKKLGVHTFKELSALISSTSASNEAVNRNR